MVKSFGAPNISTVNYSSLSSNKGVYIMQAAYPARFGAWGHATIYNNGCVGNCYSNPTGGVHRFHLWETK